MKTKSVELGLLLIALLLFNIQCDRHLVEPWGGYVRGAVSDAKTLMPVDSALILLKTEPSNSWSCAGCYTDSLGSYLLFSGPHNGKLYIEAVKDGYERCRKQIYILAVDTITVDFNLEKE